MLQSILIFLTLMMAVVPNVFSLTVTNQNDTNDEIDLWIYYPKPNTPNEKQSCYNNAQTTVYDMKNVKHGQPISTGLSVDGRPNQRICIEASKVSGTDQKSHTNPIWDVPDCKITFHRVENKTKGWITATPACDFKCHSTDSSGNCFE